MQTSLKAILAGATLLCGGLATYVTFPTVEAAETRTAAGVVLAVQDVASATRAIAALSAKAPPVAAAATTTAPAVVPPSSAAAPLAASAPVKSPQEMAAVEPLDGTAVGAIRKPPAVASQTPGRITAPTARPAQAPAPVVRSRMRQAEPVRRAPSRIKVAEERTEPRTKRFFSLPMPTVIGAFR